MDEVRIAFVGCGGNARGHMNRLVELDGASVVAVCDLVEDLANQATEITGGKAYTDYRKMLERDDLDAAYLSIPVFAHGEPELAVIDRGLPFFVEKPVARDLETARKVEEAVLKFGLTTCAGYQLRYAGVANVAREVLADQTINMIVGKYWCGSGHGNPRAWIRQYEKSGGQLHEQATHTIDMMRYLVGEVAEVQALEANRLLKEIDCADVHAVLLRFADGAIGSLTTSWSLDPSDWKNANILEILYGSASMNWSSSLVQITEKGEVSERKGDGTSIDEVFVEAVRTGDPSQIRSPYSDAIETMKISLAANEAAKTGRAVKIAGSK